MTIENTSIKNVYQGNGATTVWPYTFYLPADEFLVVTKVDVASGNEIVLAPVEYTISGAGNPAGGTVTIPVVVSSAFYIVLQRTLTLEQETDLQNQGAAYPASIEGALDYLTMITQQLQDQLNRAIIFSVADTVQVTLPTATARANLFLGFNASGDPVAIDGLTAGTTVSAAMIPVVTAPTTADALIALGIPGSLLDAMIPAGTIWDYVASVAPTSPAGFALCFGQAATPIWPVLRALLVGAGSPYGTNGVDPLLPDLRSRGTVGKSDMGGVNNGLWTGGTVLGAIAGTQSVTLTTAQIPSHLHAVFLFDPGHVHSIDVNTSGGGVDSVTQGLAGVGATVTGPVNQAFTGMSVRDAAGGGGTANQTATAGTGGSHENRQPSIILTKIIKVH